jgi:beta-lactamase class A
MKMQTQAYPPILPARRRALRMLAAAPLLLAGTAWPQRPSSAATLPPVAGIDAAAELGRLEAALDGRLGLYAVDTQTNAEIQYQAEDRFPICSTFKFVVAAAVLAHCDHERGFMRKHIMYTERDLVAHSPLTQGHVGLGMDVAQLCDAMMSVSDNTATNLLMHEIGGPEAVTRYARSLGDVDFRVDRWEPEMSAATPGDPRDTSTPKAMATTMRRVALGDALRPPQSEQLRRWLLANSVAPLCMRAGVPAGWKVGDRSGGGGYGTRNDVGILWPPLGAPIVLAIYTTRDAAHDAPRDDILAAATRIIVARLRPS